MLLLINLKKAKSLIARYNAKNLLFNLAQVNNAAIVLIGSAAD